MVTMSAIDERGSALIYALVIMVVLSITLASALQLSGMSFKTGRFQEQRQQALAAAESGISLATAALLRNDHIPTSEYPSSTPGIDSSAPNWIGPGTGSLPDELRLGADTSYGVGFSACGRPHYRGFRRQVRRKKQSDSASVITICYWFAVSDVHHFQTELC